MKSLPSAIESELDRWLHRRGDSFTAWTVQGVDEGFSGDQVWRLARKGLHWDDEQTSYSIRCWSQGLRTRQRLDAILHFQQALYLGLSTTKARHLVIPANDECQFQDSSLPSPLPASGERGAGLQKDELAASGVRGGDFVDRVKRRSMIADLFEWADGRFVFDTGKAWWTMERWLPGTRIEAGSVISDRLVNQACDILDRLHAIGHQLGTQRIVAPGFIERSERLQLARQRVDAIEWRDKAIRAGNEFQLSIGQARWQSMVAHLRDRMRQSGPWLQDSLSHYLERSLDCCWIIRDIWRENVLVMKDDVTGIVDFGASRIDWPGFDIIRWLGSWLAPDDPRLPRMLVRIAWPDPETFSMLDQVGTLLSLYQWFDWLIEGSLDLSRRSPRWIARIIELDRRLAKWND